MHVCQGTPEHVGRGSWRWWLGLLLLAAIAVVARGKMDAAHFTALLERAEPAWVLGVVGLQVGTYGCLVAVWKMVLRRVSPREAPSFSPLWLLKLALAEVFIDQALPSAGISGTMFVVSALRARGISAPATGAVVTVSLFGLYAAQLLAVISSLMMLSISRRLDTLTSAVATVAVGTALIVPAVTIAIARGGMAHAPGWLRRFAAVERLQSSISKAPRAVILDPRVIARAAAGRFAIFLLDGCTLAASLAAVGHPLAVHDAFAVNVLATTAASVSFLPGGLGSYEALSIAMLVALGAPMEAAASASLLVRGFSFWLPMLPGFVFARHELASRATERPKACFPE